MPAHRVNESEAAGCRTRASICVLDRVLTRRSVPPNVILVASRPSSVSHACSRSCSRTLAGASYHLCAAATKTRPSENGPEGPSPSLIFAVRVLDGSASAALHFEEDGPVWASLVLNTHATGPWRPAT